MILLQGIVVIVTQNGCSDTSDCYNINTVGIIENGSSASATIYPNPSNGRYTIKGNSITSIEVYNVTGEIIFRSLSNNQQTDIDLSNHSNGVYLMKIYEGQTFFTKKIILE